MAGMLRCKDEEEFKRLVAKGSLRVHSDASARCAPAGAKETSKTQRSATRANSTVSSTSEIESLLLMQIRTVGNLPEPDLIDKPYLVGRAHRIDLGWTQWTVNGWRIGVEVQGMAHRIKSKFLADIEKRVLGQQQGWLVLEVAGDHIRSGKAMEWLQALFQRATRKTT